MERDALSKAYSLVLRLAISDYYKFNAVLSPLKGQVRTSTQLISFLVLQLVYVCLPMSVFPSWPLSKY